MDTEIIKKLSRRLLVFSHDVAWVPVCAVAAYWLRLKLSVIAPRLLPGAVELVSVSVILHGLSFWHSVATALFDDLRPFLVCSNCPMCGAAT